MSSTLSVVVPTRNRPDHARACAESILRTRGFAELIFVDQSDGRETEEALRSLRDERLRYEASDQRGVTNGRNRGIALAKGDVVVFTDDDCRVDEAWASSIAHIFDTDAGAGIVCGRVLVPEDLARQGYAASFEPVVREWSGRFPPYGVDWGITANFAIRRPVFERVGGFDAALGAGGPLRGGGEPDYLFRAIRAGFKVINASEVLVHHLGIRAHGAPTAALWDNYARGTGAALFKHVRLLDPRGALLYAQFLGASTLRMVDNVVHGRRPIGAGFVVSFLKGSLDSYRFRVDRARRCYAPR
jgi:glycosyltransferase involved in cell wall biosynthesis